MTFHLQDMTKYLNEVKESISRTESGTWTDKIEIESKRVPIKKRKQTTEDDKIQEANATVSVDVVGEWPEKDAT